MKNRHPAICGIPGVLGQSVKYSALPAADYHADIDVQSCSLLKPMLTSPAHYQAQFFEVRESTPAMEFGTLIHTLVLEPHLFLAQYAVFPGKRNGRDKDFKAFCAANMGKSVIDEVVLGAARILVDKILHRMFRGRPFGDYLSEGEPEASIYFADPVTGVQCRIRIDLLHPEFLFDLKTSAFIAERDWVRHALSLDYDLQAYMYSLGLCLFTGRQTPVPFVFITAESDLPFSVSAFTAGESFLVEGGRKYREAISAFTACNSVGHWPDAGAETTIELDYWQAGKASTPAWRTSLTPVQP